VFRSESDMRKFHMRAEELKERFLVHIRVVVKDLAVQYARDTLKWRNPSTNALPWRISRRKERTV
jgi:hypothetical protein